MSIPRYTLTGDGLQDDPHGFLARWYDVERLQAEVERLTAERDGLVEVLRDDVPALLRWLPSPIQMGDEDTAAERRVRAALAALPTPEEADRE